ncbi:MAG: DUF489 family protein [Gammaproteobacteria bacterium]|nr:DUF489 family protein [Gammaproteobacteria bacterium]
MSNHFDEQLLSLGACALCVEQAHRVANSGVYDTSLADTLLNSVLEQTPSSLSVLYDDRVEQFGKRLLKNLFMEPDGRTKAIAAPLMQMLQVSKVVAQRSTVNGPLGNAISTLAAELTEVEEFDQPVIYQSYAKIYSDHVSGLKPRVMIQGKQQHLQSEENVQKIRTLLLCGLRAAVVWRQYGGRRWDLFLKRSRIVAKL